ncbi:CRISPR-associated endonuclease Cas2 [Luteolibacter ambystomatis]|uniref:CRISPR-associated endoribonuclease Cas2 n=1 Tax=Luteolibacter ambystomatis TaxID=2824561 RepID=A0A975G5S0_9BACT|nr:CRISPR-associated endonuclease Cas2 [Luteolibacter ambystomatis]QUE49842.1 CRISPR-associated endonuclease Cas2 [Luteolibacter ambystomatis]
MDPNHYKMGWLMVAFDLPVKTKAERKRATDFRKFLLDDGFQMIQFSVYARPCVTFARQETHLRRIRLAVPEEGSIRAIYITKAQWERAYIIHGKPAKEAPPEEIPEQIQLW